LLKQKESRNFPPGKLIVAGAVAAIMALCVILNYAAFASENWLTTAICRVSLNPAGNIK
jgi:hypothetical protein